MYIRRDFQRIYVLFNYFPCILIAQNVDLFVLISLWNIISKVAEADIKGSVSPHKGRYKELAIKMIRFLSFNLLWSFLCNSYVYVYMYVCTYVYMLAFIIPSSTDHIGSIKLMYISFKCSSFIYLFMYFQI